MAIQGLPNTGNITPSLRSQTPIKNQTATTPSTSKVVPTQTQHDPYSQADRRAADTFNLLSVIKVNDRPVDHTNGATKQTEPSTEKPKDVSKTDQPQLWTAFENYTGYCNFGSYCTC